MKKVIIIISILLTIIILFLYFNHFKKEKNIFESVNIYNKDYLKRYNNYYLKHPNLKIKEIVLKVNMGLDKPFYTNVKTIKYVTFNTLVNKYNKLNENYELKKPYKLDSSYTTKDVYVDKKMVNDLEKMIADMKKENLDIEIVSGYRDKEYQYSLYTKYLKKEGKEKADTYSARPRFSEHELGLTIDVRSKNGDMLKFNYSNEYIWMKKNSYKYGFILRYPEGKEEITGYQYEPWHYRYLGKRLAKKVYNSKLTYDEYYELYLRNALFS